MPAEFSFELRVCAALESQWPLGDRDTEFFVARQLGTKRRRWDTLILEVDPEGFAERAQFGGKRLDPNLLFVCQHAPADWQYYRDALPEGEVPWRYVRETIHRGAARGVLEKRKRSGRIELHRKQAYPDWLERIIAVENKPDLDASAARALSDQLERDVALGLADEVWVATESGERVLYEEMPVEAGILVFEDGALDVRWHPRALTPEQPGTRILDRGSEVCEFEYVTAARKSKLRAWLAERAYERGWRSYVDTMRPDCRHFDLKRDGDGYVPYCHAKNREQTAGECSGSCAEFSPEPPQWRQLGWPIEGGPGQTVKRVLDERRERERGR
ncbi:DUF5787 family protein [Salarchaeum japonicum]|uniref:DUF5787 family protein n=1 Tax=Salarchaeum japonicum TaxID=555573 RepID=UPI003C75E958